eukprot:TRINITY_DN62278_c0_g1_i1.p1 TRINITY_DN62278_c0_g1~~TRINITY_DN62278_c0_g1_i1.p1  ORF type:complete len:320 (+),score=58.12 TRINITY_DN62278_c0_g1_i1:97-1056(+)
MLRSLVGSEMCIRDRYQRRVRGTFSMLMRWLLLLLAALSGATELTRIMSFNIRYDNPSDRPSWRTRAPMVSSVLTFHRVHLAGLQEVLHNQLTDLSNLLGPSWGHVGRARDDGELKGEFCPVFYRKDLWELDAHDTVWLAPGAPKEAPSRPGWDAACMRIATWAKLRRKDSGERVVVMNTHLDHEGSVSREESSYLVLGLLRELRSGGWDHVVLLGDMNSYHWDRPYQLLTHGSSGLGDAKNLSRLVHHGPHHTFQGFKGEFVPSVIDFVFVSPGTVSVEQTGVVAAEDWGAGNRPSDHFALIADVVFKTQRSVEAPDL